MGGIRSVVLFFSLSLPGQHVWEKLVPFLGARTHGGSSWLGVADAHSGFRNQYLMPGLNMKPYEQKGDINIGALLALSWRADKPDTCSDEVNARGYQISEAVAFAVKYVNEHPTLLRNVSLGFVVIDNCRQLSTCLAASLAFLPRALCGNETSSCADEDDGDGGSPSTYFDVIGIVGPESSAQTVPVSTLYSAARLPIVGTSATSDELSDKMNHPYFLRMVPPDKHQVEAMIRFIHDNGWTYISVVFSQGPYGEKAFDHIKNLIDRFKICLATHHRITGSADFDEVAKDLVEHSRARVVILFTDGAVVRNIIDALRVYENYAKHFVWVGSDAWAFNYESYFKGYKDLVLGAFSFIYYSRLVPAFSQHIAQQTVSKSKNPFLEPVWEDLSNCSFSKGTCDPEQTVLENGRFIIGSEGLSVFVDAILTFAYAADNLLRERCPEARGSQARACITGDLFLSYLKNVSFEGFTGHVEFDEFSDVKAKYEIRQIVNDYVEKPLHEKMNSSLEMGLHGRIIAIYDIDDTNLTYSAANISWSHLKREVRIVPLINNSEDVDLPESVCSRPCIGREYKIEKDLHCCWECRRCRDNEKLVEANTSCETCPMFTWPEPATDYTSCAFIPLTYPKLHHSLPVMLVCFTVAALFFTLLVGLAYVKLRNERVIKAASRELSFVQLAAIFVGYLTVVLFQLKPSDVTCKLMYFLFCLTFALLYCPLLVKTVRIYRIFRSASKDNRRPRFVSPQSQVAMSFCLIGVQVVLCIITEAIFSPSSRKHQPIWSEKLVELTCDFTLPGLSSFLAYNLILVTLCSVFAFKTRKLPDNFNESKFISMCVYTTLVIWMAFIPTYFTAGRGFVQGLLLSVALLLNHSVALLFLFVPKIYAAVYVPPEQLNFVTNRFQTQNTAVASSNHRRVAPAQAPGNTTTA